MRWFVPVVLVAACGSKTAPAAERKPAAPAPATSSEQDAYLRGGAVVRGKPEWRACGPECLAAHARACEAGAEVWKLDVELPIMPVDTVYVSTTGLTRSDMGTTQQYSVDSTVWIACTECDGARTCHPTPFKMTFRSLKDESSICKRESRPGEPWHGRDTVIDHLTCGSIEVDLIVVPSLAPVREALRAVGMIPDDDPEPSEGGLVVGGAFGGQEFAIFGDVVEASCADLELPAGARNVSDADAFERLDAIWKRVVDGVISAHPREADDTRWLRTILSASNVAVCREYAR
jgi:hypothetical protein